MNIIKTILYGIIVSVYSIGMTHAYMFGAFSHFESYPAIIIDIPFRTISQFFINLYLGNWLTMITVTISMAVILPGIFFFSEYQKIDGKSANSKKSWFITISFAVLMGIYFATMVSVFSILAESVSLSAAFFILILMVVPIPFIFTPVVMGQLSSNHIKKLLTNNALKDITHLYLAIALFLPMSWYSFTLGEEMKSFDQVSIKEGVTSIYLGSIDGNPIFFDCFQDKKGSPYIYQWEPNHAFIKKINVKECVNAEAK